MFFESLCGALALMGRQVVENDHRSRLQGGCELSFDVGLKGGSVHCSLDDPRRDQRIMGQSCDEGLRAPLAKGRSSIEPLAHRCPSAQTGKVGPNCVRHWARTIGAFNGSPSMKTSR